MSSQVRGARQAVRNALDITSMVQTAEGALNETTNILQRMRELSIQAGNEFLNRDDRSAIQAELNQLKDEVNRINETTLFNNEQVFSQHKTTSLKQTYENNGELNGYSFTYDTDDDLSHYVENTTYANTMTIEEAATRRDAVVDGMKKRWLRESEKLIEQHYGLSANAEEVVVDFTEESGDFADEPGNALAFVASSTPQRMHIDLNDFSVGNNNSGGDANLYSDRIIAHEMVHVAMNANGIREDTEVWFNEGAAEFIHGAADTRTITDDDLRDAFNASTINYAGAYVATAQLHLDIIAQGDTDGIKALFRELKTLADGGHSASTRFDTALSNLGVSLTSFKAEFTSGPSARIQTFRNNLVSSANVDTGAVGNLIDGNEAKNAEDVLNDTLTPTEAKQGGVHFRAQIGDQADHSLNFSIGSFNIDAMGLESLNVEDYEKVDFAISGIEDALNYISDQRAELGAMQNRLESTVSNLESFAVNTSESQSRIVDADFAQETATLSQAQIIQQAATSILAQANTQPQLALSLL